MQKAANCSWYRIPFPVVKHNRSVIEMLPLSRGMMFGRSTRPGPGSEAGKRHSKLLRIMKLVTLFLLVFCIHVSASTYSQTVTLSGKDMQLKTVFAAIKKQTGYVVFTNRDLLANANPVSISVYDMPLEDLLGFVMKDQPFNFRIEDKTIILSEKVNERSKDNAAAANYTQVSGVIKNQSGEALPAVSVRVRGSLSGTHTNEAGRFQLLQVAEDAALVISSVGYRSLAIPLSQFSAKPEVSTSFYKGTRSNNALHLEIILTEMIDSLRDVVVTPVSTGYYDVPKERATGSFTLIDNELFNRSTGGDVLSRLEGITNGLVFNRNNLSGENIGGQPEIRVRGLSTILGNSNPLIVIDNFPYEGDINAINPNDVESVTLLRDAAAASIWGARAGNGVIVITTKAGKYNQAPRISINSNITVTEKPDLFYSRNYLPATNVMDIQKELFDARNYNPNNLTRLPVYIEWLIKKRDGEITDEEFARQDAWLRQTDNRKDWSEYLYQSAITQQHYLGIRGGGVNNSYNFSVGYDKERDMYVGNESKRLNLSLQNNFRIKKGLEFVGSVFFTRQRAQNNAVLSSVATPFIGIAPDIYEGLVDANGKPAPIGIQVFRYRYFEEAPTNFPALKLQDWMYRPLEEVERSNTIIGQNNFRVNGALKYNFLKYFNAEFSYQFTSGLQETETIYSKESYYVRNLVNSFTQANGTRIIPLGGILNSSGPQSSYSHSGRAMLRYSRHFGSDHDVSALAGTDIRHMVTSIKLGQTLYNYDPDLMTSTTVFDYNTSYPQLPFDVARIPSNITGTLAAPRKNTSRDLSYYGNASYTYKGKYIVSGSIRWDGSNLVGVNTNQRGTALWSGGLSWNVSKEPFYKLRQLSSLRLRATYGSAGNIDRTQTHLPVISLSTSTITGLQMGNLIMAGNPSLRWESVRTFNIGADFEAFDKRIDGSVEYYLKAGRHLLSSNSVDPTTGVPASFKLNYAALNTWGWDVQINSRNIRSGKFSWTTSLLFNTSNNKIINIKENPPTNDYMYITGSGYYEKNTSRDRIYALPWNGLNPEDGSVVVYDKDGNITRNYQDYYLTVRKDKFVVAGLTMPPITGSIRNTFEWNGVSVSAVITGRFDFVFRRASQVPGGEYVNSFHTDYFKRWKQPGDEKFTNVPAAMPLNTIPNTTNFHAQIYTYSDALITPGDNIRLQDVNFSYTLPGSLMKRSPFKSVRIYGYARSLGIIWKANDVGLDPDYARTKYPQPKSFAAGLQVEF